MPPTQCESWADETDMERGADCVKGEEHGVCDIDWELMDDDGDSDGIGKAITTFEDETGPVAGYYLYKEVKAQSFCFEARHVVPCMLCFLHCWALV